jgi:Transmembrane secretion effector
VGVWAAFNVRNFRALLLSYAINRAGDELGVFALAIVVYDRTGSALATAALFLATQFGPGLLGPLVVARVDHMRLGRVLPAIYLAETALFAVLAAIAAHGPVALVIALAFVDATLAFTARVLTRAGAASTLADRDLIAEGKAAFNVVFAIALSAGPALAGVLVVTGGASTALAIDSGSFLLAALIVAAERGLRSAVAESDEGGSAWARVGAGLRYLRGHPALRGLIAAEGIAFVFFYFPIPVIVVFAKQTLHAGVGGYGAILATWGVGVVLGSLLLARMARRAGPTMILASTGAVAVGYLGTAASPSLAVACCASVVGGIGNGTQWAAVETVVHRLVAEAFRARVAATLETLMAIAPGFGIIGGGALAAAWSPRAAYYIAGAGACALIVGSLVSHEALFGAAAASPRRARAPAGDGLSVIPVIGGSAAEARAENLVPDTGGTGRAGEQDAHGDRRIS